MKRDFSLVPTSRSRRPRRPIEIVMTPMIDVIFLLLVFFLATSTFQLVEQYLPSGVSETSDAAGAATAPQDPSDDVLEQVIIRLEKQGEATVVRMNGLVLPEFEQLKSRLQAVQEAGSDVPVIIDPAGEIIATEVIRAYDWARQAGLARVYLATRG